jgi:mono/diheme cytochrome c family protein
LIEDQHRVRPTSGLEFVSSRHFPDEVQGDLLINNTIGFLGTKQHMMMDDGTGYVSKHRHDLVQSTDINFRPVDMEFAPDGSLYLVDWHNILVGHMQHNARDPLRDHSHGRIYRITYPSRPLVTPAKVHNASIKELLDNLKLPEYRTRYRSRRELRGRDVSSVLAELELWTQELDSQDPEFEHHLLEALWVSWGLNQINRDILTKLMNSDDFRVRAAAVRAIRYMGHQLDDQTELLIRTASDQHGRVRLESIVAASWLDQESGMKVIETAREHEMDKWMVHAFQTAEAHLNGKSLEEIKEEAAKTHLEGADLELFNQGKQVYERDGSCMTCHQVDGKGLDASGFPPLAGTKWVLESEERLIKIALNGLYGPITVLNKQYAGAVPMTPNRDLLDDQELAGVLTYVRNAFGNKASVITVEKVKQVRQTTLDKQGFYTAEELLKQHPHAESE